MKKLLINLAVFMLIFQVGNAQTFNYAEALQKSLYFYDANKCGSEVTGGRLSWRGDCHVADTALTLNEEMTNMSSSFISANSSVLDPDGDGTVDVSGGYHDAGDHVQFGLPQSYSTSTVEWAFYEFEDAFANTGIEDHIREITRWGSDYFLKNTFRNASGEVVAFCYQVGEGNIDHNFWGPPELIDTDEYPRPAYFATSEDPASDQCAGAAASLAVSYLNNQAVDPSYADECLEVAEALYEFAVENRGLGYSGGFYNSSYDEDELAWAAVWLYIATEDQSYIDDITSKDANGMFTGWLGSIINSTEDQWQNIWVHSWDTKWGGIFAKLAPITDDDLHWYIFRWNLEYWSGEPHENPNDNTYLAKTPDGFSYLNSWGSARYNAAAQFQAMVYKKYTGSDKFDAWMTDQMNYIMGDNPLDRSYIVGYSDNYAEHPHHRAAHGSPNNSMFNPPEHKHILWGALVGGPDSEDNHVDETNDFIYNEVAIDYNAGVVGALAGHYTYFGEGQQSVTNFPPPDPDLKEYEVEAKIEQESEQRSQLSIRVTNESAFPPRKEVNLMVRYFFDISEMMEYDQDISDLSFEVYYDENAVNSDPVISEGPFAWDAANGIYYMEFQWPESGFYGTREYQFGLIAGQDANYTSHWDPTNDFSYQDLGSEYIETSNIPLYVEGEHHSGSLPDEQSDNTAPTAVASATPVSGNVPLTVSFDASGSSDPDGDTLSYEWIFGDGNTATGATTSHTYEQTGEYTATVTVNDGNTGTDNASVTITVSDESVTQYSLSSSTIGLGSITLDPSGGTYDDGTVVTVTATADAGYQFDKWSGDLSGSVNPEIITMDSDKSVTANFSEDDTPPATPCDNPVSITLPFTYDGSGEYCWVTSDDIAYINSWNTDAIEINGVDYTNSWANSFPDKIDGNYYIYYSGSLPWAHFEVSAVKSATGAESASLEGGKESNTIKLYPNPFSETITLDIQNPEQVESIVIVDQAGRTVSIISKANIKASMKIGGDFATGIYVVQVNEGDTSQHFVLSKQ